MSSMAETNPAARHGNLLTDLQSLVWVESLYDCSLSHTNWPYLVKFFSCGFSMYLPKLQSSGGLHYVVCSLFISILLPI
jgi:hypothetical protein